MKVKIVRKKDNKWCIRSIEWCPRNNKGDLKITDKLLWWDGGACCKI